MIDAIKSCYADGIRHSEAGADKAREAACWRGVAGPGVRHQGAGATLPAKMALIAEDLMEQSKTNRELVVGLVRTEVERAVGRIGFCAGRGTRRGPGPRRPAGRPVARDHREGVAVPAQAAEEAGVGPDSAKTLAESTALRKMGLTHAAPR